MDLTKCLELVPSIVNNHLENMKQVDIIKVDFFPNFYKVSLNHKGKTDLKGWTSSYQ